MRHGKRRGIPFVAIVLLVALSLFYQGCSREKRYNVLLICVDTLRPDHLGYNGYSRNTSPAIDKLASEGVRFEKGYSAAGWTLPSMATILTGLYPKDHLATDFHWAMDPAVPTLAAILRWNGYDTRAYVSHVFLKPMYGFGEGFRSFDYSVLNVGDSQQVSTAKALTDLVIADLPKIEKPFFMWVHYFDPHFAYLSHEGWESFGDTDVDRYDQEIAYTDSQIARLIERLKRKGLWDHTIVIFTADHGEEFGEHGGKYHETLYEEVLRVPVVIVAPFLEPGVNKTIVQQIDFVPTILGLLKIPAPPNLPGKNLFAGSDESRPIFVERDRPFPWVLRGVIDGNDKLLVVEVGDSAQVPMSSRGNYAPIANVIPGTYMFDLSQDPGEKRNIYSDSNPRAKVLLALLARQYAGPRERVHRVEVDEELNKKLRSLGYIR
jgi:arylsulfatase A-like enzyme